MTKRTSFDLHGFLPYQLKVLADHTSRAFAARYSGRFGISVAEWRVVANLNQADGPVSVREIHARVDMDKSKVSRAAARLEAAGYITKTPSQADGRLVELALSEAGHAMMAELAQEAEAYQAEVVAQLGPEAEAFTAALDRLMATRRRCGTLDAAHPAWHIRHTASGRQT